jgi:hypothetical protein
VYTLTKRVRIRVRTFTYRGSRRLDVFTGGESQRQRPILHYYSDPKKFLVFTLLFGSNRCRVDYVRGTGVIMKVNEPVIRVLAAIEDEVLTWQDLAKCGLLSSPTPQTITRHFALKKLIGQEAR